MVGMPGVTTVDLTSLWHREVTLTGAYAYTADDFTSAFELVRDCFERSFACLPAAGAQA